MKLIPAWLDMPSVLHACRNKSSFAVMARYGQQNIRGSAMSLHKPRHDTNATGHREVYVQELLTAGLTLFAVIGTATDEESVLQKDLTT